MRNLIIVGTLLAFAVTAFSCVAFADERRAHSTSRDLTIDLTATGASEYNIDHAGRGLRLPEIQHERAAAAGQTEGFYVTGIIRADMRVSQVKPYLDARTSTGSRVMLELRGRLTGGKWTEWRESSADGQAIVLPHPAESVQARITLLRDEGAASPEVKSLRLVLVADQSAAERRQGRKPFSSRVFATRIGLVGGTTANGHTIQPSDRFVALPSRRALNIAIDDRAYEVRVCHKKRCTVAPVWDVGPWNIRDDYWNVRSVRQMWKDLPRGRPQAESAYLQGHNQGLDDRSRKVLNPAGIDLADGIFWKDLGMTTNGWVKVTYLWTGADSQA
ncbi:hypothetical protein [Nonomuraea soli]|uniref:DNRLRE domain-containing protein n=1 Tax=Nonomuraea soli TaxID=1032476 RepID=A0A7W0CI39_9ACTN|nr:hypothetical protein [Nonomuraea soli]MBA2891392.1 hypothetical protein [Nonomuraea soli]